MVQHIFALELFNSNRFSVADDLPPDARTPPGSPKDIAAQFGGWDPMYVCARSL